MPEAPRPGSGATVDAALGAAGDPVRSRGADSSRRFRRDLEGLRAIAALLVAVYHIWFHRVSGGVDVFFVIAGFLITGTLLRQVRAHGRVEILAYLGRLMVRLLPQAITVLVAVGVATVVLFPITRRSETFTEIATSALYVENWQLIANATDYLAREREESPVQHFWAMSVQGQFYLLWLVLAVAAAAAGVAALAHRRFTALIALVTAASFVYSLYLTATDQPVAYFHTATRAWEFGVGALVALGGSRLAIRSSAAKWILGWTGLGLILATGVVVPVSDTFPGVAALLPVTGAVLVLAAGSREGQDAAATPQRHRHGSATGVLSWSPLVSLGGVAYAVYLWHWPVLVFSLQVRGLDQTDLRGGLVVLGASILLAYASTTLIERPVRSIDWRRFGDAMAPALGIAAVASMVVAALTIGALSRPTMPVNDQAQLSHWAQPGSSPDFALPVDEPYPPILDAAHDRPLDQVRQCQVGVRQAGVVRCSFGDLDADRRMVLAGGSHSLHWFPALEQIAEQTGWELELIVKGGCRQGMHLVGPDYRLYGESDTEANQTCRDWSAEMLQLLLDDPPDLVVGSTTVVEGGSDILPPYMELFWRELDAADISTLGIRATPRGSFDRITCMAENGVESPNCSIPRSATFAEVNPALQLEADLDHFTTVDLSDWLCDEVNCPPVIENIVVYHDAHHLTITFSRALSPPLFRAAAEIFLDG